MADALKAVYARLAAHTGLKALVGSRIYPVAQPQDAQLPLVRYRLLTATRTNAFGADIVPTRNYVQVGSAGKTYASAKAVAAQVQAALQRWSGTATGIVVQGAFLDSEMDGPWDPDLEAYTVEQDYIIWHEE